VSNLALATAVSATALCLLLGCGGNVNADPSGDAAVEDAGLDVPSRGVVHVVLFTHIEDTSPSGTLGSDENRTIYRGIRSKLIEVAKRARARRLQWVLQPDWKYLEAARLYEDPAMTADTGGKNLFKYLRDDLAVVIDPHSHENGGYNYTDVAYLLEQLGVGGSTVIGGHIWDPTLPQFQRWDRFRAAVSGEHYPTASWRGDILIGAGTPGHVNDPLVSGVWRPKDRDHYFVDDPGGNIVSTGAWHDGVNGVRELVDLYAKGNVPPSTMLTASWNIRPSDIMADIDKIDTGTFAPIASLRDEGTVVVTDFTTLVATWRSKYAANGAFHPPR
jgi:hypothetical protein